MVTARKDTIGIFVFETEQQAEDFKRDNPKWMIIRVKPIGKGTKLLKRPVCFANHIIELIGLHKEEILNANGDNLYSYIEYEDCLSYYDGTMVYDSVIPID